VAAGKFLENDEVTEEGWEEAPEDLRVTPDLFVARIEGHSMEPLIPDGSLAVFRASIEGSRQGRLVLVEDLGTGGTNRYTVKRYRSEKAAGSEGEWRHTRIRLESLNPEYPSWELDPSEGKYRIIAEFERILE
jgi:phage repressor protein C with HTH and peptisase S24 domain